ncbi:MAG: dihydropteroate synthase [Spirochaetes bacterium RBG_16_49_21]|nr:MAG: dihydropteroate synthase [Spirochaetes bacterium RBG_16_49_21]
MGNFIRIGENLNVMSKILGPAMKERNPAPIQDMAKKETEKGVDYIDVNIGPARKGGDEMMAWLVKVIQDVTDTPLALDTTNMEAMEAGLKACKKGKALINSISLQTSRIEAGLKLAAKYEADCIALLWSDQGMPRDANERAMHIVDFMAKAAEIGVPNEKLWVDPIVSPISVEINQVKACVEFMSMLKDIAPGAKSTCGLSNISNGVQDNLRPWLNITYLIMLMKHGLYSAIVDSFDETLNDFINGKKDNIVRLIHRMMDGEKVDINSLSAEEAKYAKSVRVLAGESLFSNSWLDI